jgi:hypothetical protein
VEVCVAVSIAAVAVATAVAAAAAAATGECLARAGRDDMVGRIYSTFRKVRDTPLQEMEHRTRDRGTSGNLLGGKIPVESYWGI